MIYLFIVLFCLNATAVWGIALLLAEVRMLKEPPSQRTEE